MRMWTAQDARVQHAVQVDVARVGGAAGCALAGVDALRCVSHGLELAEVAARRGLLRCGEATGSRQYGFLIAVISGAAADVAGHTGLHFVQIGMGVAL